MSKNTIIVINNDYLDTIKRNPRLFIDGIVSRIENEENDPYPGYARWNGDALPGVQVVKTIDGMTPSVFVVSKNAGKKLFDLAAKNIEAHDSVAILKDFAKFLGFSISKRKPTNKSNNQQKK